VKGVETVQVFHSSEWQAKRYVTAEQIKQALDGFKLVGRRIKSMRLLGQSFYHTRYWVESTAYDILGDELPEEERQLQSEYENISQDWPFFRFSQTDEPLMILFEDGDHFEIEVPWESEFLMSMNAIPWEIKAERGLPNVDANVLFLPCLEQKIVDVKIRPQSAIATEAALEILLCLENDVKLCIGSMIDYTAITCLDENDNTLFLPFSELRPALSNDEE